MSYQKRKRKPSELTTQVEYMLRNVPETRNSDITLMIAIWERYYPTKLLVGQSGAKAVLLKNLYDLPREDAIKRARAKFNEEGKYYPTDWKVAKQRGIKEDEWREILGYPTKGETVHPTKNSSYMDPERGFTPYPN